MPTITLPLLQGCAAAVVAGIAIGAGVAHERRDAKTVLEDQQIEVQAKYAGYIERQRDEVERARRAEAIRLPGDFDYANVKGLSAEVSQKLALHRPATIGQASRISGVTPAAISLLLVHLRKAEAARRVA